MKLQPLEIIEHPDKDYYSLWLGEYATEQGFRTGKLYRRLSKQEIVEMGGLDLSRLDYRCAHINQLG
jgi:hypothetical protein